MGALARLVGVKTASGGPNTSDDGTFSVSPWILGLLGSMGTNTRAGVAVTEDTALGLPTLYACIRVLSEDVAKLPLILYRTTPDGGRERAKDHPLYPVFHDAPNPAMDSFVWRETLITHLAGWGNAYNEIAFDQVGRLQLWPMMPNRTEVRLEGGERVYYYHKNSGERVKMRPGSVFHITDQSLNGLIGMSRVAYHRETIGEHFATRGFGANFYRNNARPATVLAHPKNLSEGAIQRLAKQMEEMRGSGNAGKTVVLEEGLEIKEIGVPPEDAQYIETRKLQREEIAQLYRMQQHKVGILDHATFSNIEEQNIDYVTGTLMSWLVRVEKAIQREFLFGEPDLYVEHLVDALLRGNAESRAKALQIRWQAGNVSPNDWRRMENENPIEGGDTYYVPVNYKAANAPELPPEPNGNGSIDLADLERVA